MKLKRKCEPASARQEAYTLAEIMVAVAVTGLMFLSLYAGISSGFRMMQITRENLRATQILLERMETIRLYSWEQVTNTTYIPRAFTEYFYPDGVASNNGGIMYTGMVSILPMPAGLPPGYANDMRLVSNYIAWVSSKNLRQRGMATYVARYGLQNYVYSPTNSP